MFRLFIIFSLLCAFNVHADNKDNDDGTQANSADIISELHQLTALGQGTMKVMFWKVYKAQFFTDNKDYQPAQFPQALKITYLRDIDGEDLVSATDEQWQHLNIEKKRRDKWIALLNPIFPNVTDQDTIILYVDKKQHSRFYFQQQGSTPQLIGSIDDSAFGAAFLSIWLSKDTSRPKFRRKLLGASS